MLETIGYYSLNISLVLYCIYFIPQIIYNQIIKKTDQISLVTQGLMVSANLCDLIYGFYLFMPWQYKLVTILSLSFLVIQQFQIGLKQYRNFNFIGLSSVLVIFLVVTIDSVSQMNLPPNSINLFGMVTDMIYWIYWVPQILFNWRNKKADGFSQLFLLLTLLASICDEVSALILGWNYPSIIGPLVIIFMILIILFQHKLYAKNAN
ncbi:PQ-loop repeat-containing protein [Thiotrichales bacterium 19S3-7]|nr:PQ-loop repeat-containing protein [Thiotrichales bacterium 19S3-7]MCF6800874.1 PQ-loop repeat-containing protein [Thiotrichales bacterium 19S3-11]